MLRRAQRPPDRWVEPPGAGRLPAWIHEPTQQGRPPADDEPATTVVLVHGWTLSSPVWDRLVALAGGDDGSRGPIRGEGGRRDLRIIRYDQRGHGASLERSASRRLAGMSRSAARQPQVDQAPASIGRLADDLVAVVEQLAPTGPLVLLGHSMGGMAILAAAGRHPELLGPRLRGVVLCSTSATSVAAIGRPVAPLMAALAHLPAGVVVPRAPRLLAQRTNYGPRADAALVAATLRSMGPVSGRSTGEWFAALMAHDESAALPALAAARTPVTVLVGDADRLTPTAHAQAIAAALPQARLRIVEGAGHMLVVERPDVVLDAVGDLLDA